MFEILELLNEYFWNNDTLIASEIKWTRNVSIWSNFDLLILNMLDCF